ncbi:MAG: hypothetical protein K0U98_19620 [Deltaproteobacteria bacterium]|nr:hypothetical protein [Deltaproteobacteria bacterium]
MRPMSTVLNAIAILFAVSILTACGGAEAGSSSAKGANAATGNLAIHGPFELSFGKVGRSSRLSLEPFRETLALRLMFQGVGEDFSGAIVDINDIPSDLGEGTFSLDSGEVSAVIGLLSGDPTASSPRFSVESGTLTIKLDRGLVSGTLSGEAERITFDRDARTEVTFEADFEGVLLKEQK